MDTLNRSPPIVASGERGVSSDIPTTWRNFNEPFVGIRASAHRTRPYELAGTAELI